MCYIEFIGNPIEVSLLEFANEIARITGSKSKIVFKPLPVDDPKQRQPDITLAKNLLDWEPKVDRSEGLTRTLAYFQAEMAAQQTGVNISGE
jgi:dTDP-glucose 4,6-dehydratase